MAAQHLVIMGPMAAGKSTVGRALAAALDRPYRDSDDDLAAERGITGRALARAEGVGALHRWEARHLARALADPTPAVVAPAASTVEDAGLRRALADHVVVVLTARPDVLVARMRAGDWRRELGDDEADALDGVAAIARRRAPWFAEVADVVVDVSDLSPPEAVATVLRRLPASLRAPGHGRG